jgi:hypothetical protein
MISGIKRAKPPKYFAIGRRQITLNTPGAELNPGRPP